MKLGNCSKCGKAAYVEKGCCFYPVVYKDAIRTEGDPFPVRRNPPPLPSKGLKFVKGGK